MHNHSNHSTNFTHNDLLEAEIWTSVTLSSVSLTTLIVFWIIYATAQVRTRDRARENRRTALRKLCKHEYLIFSYSVSLSISHLVTIVQKSMQFLIVKKLGSRVHNMCLVVAVLKHYFWLLALFHCVAISYKLYVKLTRTTNSIVERKNRLKPILLTLAFIFSFTSFITVFAIILHFTIPSTTKVYDVPISISPNEEYKSPISICFLNQPLFLLVLFILPVFGILIFDVTIFIILFVKTQSALNSRQNENGDDSQTNSPSTIENTNSNNNCNNNSNGVNGRNFLFPKLAILMGLPWLVSVLAISFAQIPDKPSFALSLHILSSIQINSQGLLLVIVLFSNATYEKLFNKRSTKRANNNNNNNQNQNKRAKIRPLQQQQRLTVL